MADYEYVSMLNWNYEVVPGQRWSWGEEITSQGLWDVWGSFQWVGYAPGADSGGVLAGEGDGYDFRYIEIWYWPDRDVNIWEVFHIDTTFFESGIEVPVDDLGDIDGMSTQFVPNYLTDDYVEYTGIDTDLYPPNTEYPTGRGYAGHHRTKNNEPFDGSLQECTWNEAFSGIHNDLLWPGSPAEQGCGGSLLPVVSGSANGFRMWGISDGVPMFTTHPNFYKHLASKWGIVKRRKMRFYGYRSVPVPGVAPAPNWNTSWYSGWSDSTGTKYNYHREFVRASIRFQLYSAGVSPASQSNATTAYIEHIDNAKWSGFTAATPFPYGVTLGSASIGQGQGNDGTFSDPSTWTLGVVDVDFDEADLDSDGDWYITFSDDFLRGADPGLSEPPMNMTNPYAYGASLTSRALFTEIIVRGSWLEQHIVPVIPELLCPPHLRLVQRQDVALGLPGNQPTTSSCNKAVRLLGRGEVDQNLTPGKSPRVRIPNSYF